MYIGNDLSRGRVETYYYTSTSGGETSITTDSSGKTINYTVGWVAVYLNGVRLHDSDFTATTGNSITGLAALSQDDVVIIEAQHTFSSSDAVPSTGGTFSGNVSFGDNNITNVGSIALDSISADGSSITLSSNTTASGNLTITGDLIPSEPLSNRNMIINGGMQIWQRSTDITASDGSNEGFNSIDRWYFNFNSSCPGTLDIDKSTDTPSGFGSSMKLKCNATGTPAGSSTDFVMASTTLEAQDLQRLCYGTADAKVTTLSWYMKSVNFTTPISVSVETIDGTKEYYHVNVSPTTSWARHSITIPKSTSATINNDNGGGFLIGFVLSGSTDGSLAEANDSSAWSTTQKTYRTNQTNFFASTSNELYITGLQFELGENATPYEHKSYGEELARCQRYYYKITNETGGENTFGVGVMDGTTVNQWSIPFPVTMRIAPTGIETSGTAGDYSIRSTHNVTLSGVPAHYHCTKNSAAGSASVSDGSHFITKGASLLKAVDNDAYLAWSADL